MVPKRPNFKISTTIKSTTYVFTITSNDQISYYSLTVLSTSLRCPYFIVTPLQNDMVFLLHLNHIPVTVHKWAVDIGSSSTQNWKLISASECTDGGHCRSDAHLLSLFEFGGAGGGGTYEGCYLIATEHFIHISFVISEAVSR